MLKLTQRCVVLFIGELIVLSHEDVVTNILSRSEILGSEGELYDKYNNRRTLLYNTNPVYDLNKFIKTIPSHQRKYEGKYIFIK